MAPQSDCTCTSGRPFWGGWVQGSGCGVWGVGCEVQGAGGGVLDVRRGVWGMGYGVWGLGYGVWVLRVGVRGMEFGVWDLRFNCDVGAQGRQVTRGGNMEGFVFRVRISVLGCGVWGSGGTRPDK